MKRLFAYLQHLMEGKYYGHILIKFEAGKIVYFEKKITEDVKQFN